MSRGVRAWGVKRRAHPEFRCKRLRGLHCEKKTLTEWSGFEASFETAPRPDYFLLAENRA
jgi:hypothetical protein